MKAFEIETEVMVKQTRTYIIEAETKEEAISLIYETDEEDCIDEVVSTEVTNVYYYENEEN